jgi:hypothetical protein
MQERDWLFKRGNIKPGLGFKLVSPDDIEFVDAKPIKYALANKLTQVPYCLDLEQKLLINATGIDPFQAAKATFHYAYLRANANGFLCVPVEKIPKEIERDNVAPFLLFSPGRCGSTLLTKILAGMGVISISEPDFYSQAAHYVALGHKTLNEVTTTLDLLRYANTLLFQPFRQAAPRKVMIKFRSDVNRAPGIIVASFSQKPKTIFLTRGFGAWCESRRRVFSNSLEQNLQIYTRALLTLKFLRQHTNCLVIHYEDFLTNPDTIYSNLSSFFEVSANHEALAAVIKEDSQAGTALSKERVKKQLSDDELQAIAKLWQEKAPQALLKELKQLGFDDAVFK